MNTTAPGYEFHTCSSRVELDENDLTSVGALDAFTVLYRVKFSDNLDPQLTSVAVSDLEQHHDVLDSIFCAWIDV